MLTGKFVFISGTERQKDGRFFYNANIELEDGSLCNMGTELEVLNRMKKYQPYVGSFRLSVYNNMLRLRLVDVVAATK